MAESRFGGTAAPRRITGTLESGLQFSICTLVSRPALYEKLHDSFRAGGFAGDDVEFLYVDNSAGNEFEAYAGLNRMIAEARGKYIILCHQDVALLYDDREVLLEKLAELDSLDPGWALAGNAGKTAKGRSAVSIFDIGGDRRSKPLPQQVVSLDENFIVLRRDSLLGFSRDLGGFHFYGTDLCLQAEWRGWSAYVIDFHLRHSGEAKRDETFLQIRDRLERKFNVFRRGRIVETTCTRLLLGRSRRIEAVREPLRRFERVVRQARNKVKAVLGLARRKPETV